MLSVLSEYIPQIPPLSVDGIFGPATRESVISAQRWFGLPQTGTVDQETWDEIYDQFSGIENRSLRDPEVFPERAGVVPAFASTNRQRTRSTTRFTQFPGKNLQRGNQDPVSQEVIR